MSASLRLTESLSAQLVRLDQQSPGASGALALAALFVLLYRYCSRESIAVATFLPRALGARPGIDARDATFISLSLDADWPFDRVLEQVEQALRDANENTAPPMASLFHADVLEEAITILHQVQFEPAARQGLPGDDHRPPPDIALSVAEDAGRFTARVSYDGSVFDASTIERLLGHYENLLADAIASPQTGIGRLRLMSAQEAECILHEWNATEVPFVQPGRLHAMFEVMAERTPDAIAVVCGTARLTYAALNAGANRLAHHLRGLGVVPGNLVGIYMNRSIDAVMSIFGVLKTGAAYLPLDASYPVDRIALILQDAQARILLSHGCHAERLKTYGAPVVFIDAEGESLARQPSTNLPSLAGPADIAFVLYTSGSTGKPKGVQITHANMINNFFAWEHTHRLRESISAVCQVAFFSFAVFQGDVFRALSAGKKLVICPNDVLASPARLTELMRSEKVDFGEFVPTLMRKLIDHLEGVGSDLAFMRVIVISADRWYLREHAEVARLCGIATRLVHVYGLSETTLDSTFFAGTEYEMSPADLVPIGKPFPNVQAYILDERRQPVPIGVVGEVYVGGAGVANGYLGSPGLTAERFVPNPFNLDPKNRLFRTGDLGKYLPDGNIAFLGRRDAQVKISGFRVEPGEIEAHMAKFPGVRQAVVQPLEPTPGKVQLVGYHVSMPAAPVDEHELRQFLADKLPPFMVPTYFIRLDALPLTPSGKVDRGALPRPPAPQVQVAGSAVAPRSELEFRLATIWAEVLRRECVGVDENFFALGGDSLSGVEVVMRAEEAGVSFTYDDLSRHPTVAELAAVAVSVANTGGRMTQAGAASLAGNAVTVTPEQLARLGLTADMIESARPLTATQSGIYLQNLLAGPKGAVYLEQATHELNGPLDPDTFSLAWDDLIQRHAAFRTGFVRRGLRQPLQLVYKTAESVLGRRDFSADSSAMQRQLLAQCEASEIDQGFDLTKPPLTRAVLIRLADERHLLVWTYHHIIMDGWSKSLAERRLLENYVRLTADPAESPGRDHPIGDSFSLATEFDAVAAEAFWRNYLGGFTCPNRFGLASPVSRIRSADHAFAAEDIWLPAAGCLAACQRLGLTLNTLLQGMWVLVLGELSGDRDIVYGTAFDGRDSTRSGSMSTVGMFVNTMPTRVKIVEEQPLANWLLDIQANLAQLRRYQHTPLARIQEWSEVPKNRLPLVNAFCVLLNFPSAGVVLANGSELELIEKNFQSRPHYPLTLFVVAGAEVRLRVVFKTAEYAHGIAGRILQGLASRLGRAVEDPGQNVAALMNTPAPRA